MQPEENDEHTWTQMMMKKSARKPQGVPTTEVKKARKVARRADKNESAAIVSSLLSPTVRGYFDKLDKTTPKTGEK